MNINDDELNLVTITVKQARALDFQGIDATDNELAEALDEAQSRVFSGDAKRSFLVIEITP